MRLLQHLTAILAVSSLLAGAARADDYALNKEGYWTVGRGEADAQSCKASIRVGDEAVFLLSAAGGKVSFAAMSKARIRGGKQAVLATEAYSFAFAPVFNDKRDMVFPDGQLDDRAVAALKLARSLTVAVDNRPLIDAEVEGTGLENAIEGLLACSKGESGWWGPGLGAAAIQEAAEAPGEMVMNKEGLWGIVPGGSGVCVAQANIDDGRFLQILAAEGRLGLAVGAADPKGARIPKGRAAQVESDGYAFTFVPQYDETGRYMNSTDTLDDVAVGILRKAKWIRVTIDRKTVADVALEGSGFPELLDAVAACSRGEKGWWGGAAKAP